MNRKTVIIGIDGVPYKLMDDLSNKGIMPYFQKLKSKGIFRKMRSSIPHISSVSWSSIITGSNPAQHGIFGFTDLIPNTYTLSFPDFNALKVKPFWHHNENKKYVIINVPSTYPVKPLNGVHISGFISLDMDKAVYPSSLLGKLEELQYEVDVDAGTVRTSKSLFLKKLTQTNEARINTYRYLWEKEKWDVFMFVFTGSDRLEHFLWNAYEDKTHEHHQAFLNYFKRVDEIIGEINQRISDNDSLIILSDHGMEQIKTNVNINYFLEQTKFLYLDKSKKEYNQITKKSLAFSLDPGRIYLHRESRYPHGSVKEQDEKNIIQDLTETLSNIEYNNEKVIKKIYQKQEIYHGTELERAPDLVLIENPGFSLRGAIEKNTLFEQDPILTGKHTLEDSVLFVKSENADKIVPPSPTVEDMVSILSKLNK
ncbi:alkaline phosphatase family protein [Patescibacteria group bacterium AH-259-L05]|nr:alkaline phosphatase family protein [Patescibacteria group bacterium AH-259-L05]